MFKQPLWKIFRLGLSNLFLIVKFISFLSNENWLCLRGRYTLDFKGFWIGNLYEVIKIIKIQQFEIFKYILKLVKNRTILLAFYIVE